MGVGGLQEEIPEEDFSCYLLEMKSLGSHLPLGGIKTVKKKKGNIKKVLAARKSTLLPMKAMKLEAIVRHRDSIKPREAFRSGNQD